MKAGLAAAFAVVLAAMLYLTISASLELGILAALERLWPELWFRATLADAYFAFLTVWGWVAWRERTWRARAAWLVLFCGLGSMGIAIYVLIQLAGSRGEFPAALMRRKIPEEART